jgi:hypothetical protein
MIYFVLVLTMKTKLRGDGEQWIMWDEMHRLLKDGELGTEITCLWELYVLCLSSS